MCDSLRESLLECVELMKTLPTLHGYEGYCVLNRAEQVLNSTEKDKENHKQLPYRDEKVLQETTYFNKSILGMSTEELEDVICYLMTEVEYYKKMMDDTIDLHSAFSKMGV